MINKCLSLLCPFLFNQLRTWVWAQGCIPLRSDNKITFIWVHGYHDNLGSGWAPPVWDTLWKGARWELKLIAQRQNRKQFFKHFLLRVLNEWMQQSHCDVTNRSIEGFRRTLLKYWMWTVCQWPSFSRSLTTGFTAVHESPVEKFNWTCPSTNSSAIKSCSWFKRPL